MYKTEIVSSSSRQIVDLGDRLLIYVPLDKIERDTLARGTINPCFRITVKKEETRSSVVGSRAHKRT